MLNLYLLRHGKAAKPEGYDEDFDRPLNKKGIAQINQVGFRLQSQENQPLQVISSSAVRTKQTTAIANSFIGVDDITYEKGLYLAREDFILDTIKKHAKSDSILYVGHNFGISDLASSLSNERISMSTGMIVHLKFDFKEWELIGAGLGTIADSFAPQIHMP